MTIDMVPFLNGLDAYDRLDQCFGQDSVPGGVACIATMLGENGASRHLGTSDVVITGASTPLLRAAYCQLKVCESQKQRA